MVRGHAMKDSTARRLTKLRVAAGSALVVTSLVASMPWEAWAADAVSARPPRGVPVAFYGAPISRATNPAARAHELAEAFLDTRIRIVTGTESIEGTRRELGVRADEPTLARWLEQAFDRESDLNEAREAEGVDGTIDLLVPWSFEPGALAARLAELGTRTNRPAVDARMNLETGVVSDEHPGIRLDVDATLDAVRASFDSNTSVITAVVRSVPAHRTRAMLNGASLAAVLGEFDTRYNPSQTAEDRTHNLRVAASRIDGYVLLPGEEFDFNQVVGERSEANGFRAAPVIEAGEIDLGVGGGTCQISGTLHAAVFFAGLPILGRLPHSRPSSYIKLGLDAMVTWPEKNFRFRNDFDHPVVLRLSVRDGTVHGEIRGPARTRMVSFVRRVDGVTPYIERFDDDPTLPAGTRVLVQRGMPGFRLTRFRVIRHLDTQQAIRERQRDQYPPTVQIWRVGTGAPASADYVPPAGDSHPEYRADELVEMTQGPGITGTEERATAGRTGIVGWTRTAGMPFAE